MRYPDDPLLRQIIFENPSVQSDLDPQTGIIRRDMPSPDMPALPSPPGQGQSAMEQLQAMLAQHQQPHGFMDRLAGLREVPMPRSSNERDVGGRSFLSGLTHGVNARAERGQNEQSSMLKRLLLEAQIRQRTAQAQKAEAGAQAGAAGVPVPKVDPFEEDKHAWWKARVGAAEASGRAADALAARRGRPDQPRVGRGGGGGSKSGGAGNSRAELAARYRAALARATESAKAIGAKEMWSKEQIAAAVSRQKARIAAEYQALLNGTPMPNETPGAAGPASRPDPLGIR